MRTPMHLAIAMTVLLTTTIGHARHQPPVAKPDDPSLPAPGTRGNADNVPFIGRRDPGNNPVRLAKATGHVSNYNEEKVAPYTLPDPLVMASGERLTAPKVVQERRPEILKFYQTEIYGRVPANAPEGDLGGDRDRQQRPAMARRSGSESSAGWETSRMAPKMNLTMHLPARANGPVPMLLSISFGFGAADAARRRARPRLRKQRWRRKARSGLPADSMLGEVLGHGWGYASLGYTDIQPDRADRWTEGVIGLTLKPGQTQPAPDEWGTISAGPGASAGRSTTSRPKSGEPEADRHHGRLAAGQDRPLGRRPGQARGGRVLGGFWRDGRGPDPSRLGRDPGRHGTELPLAVRRQPPEVGRQVERSARRSAHADRPVRTRPVYVNGGLTDQWSDPKGEFLTMVAAGPVYRLLGHKDLGVTELPPLDTPITGGDLAFHYHSGGHMAVPADWKAFLDFVDRHIRAPGRNRRETRSAHGHAPVQVDVIVSGRREDRDGLPGRARSVRRRDDGLRGALRRPSQPASPLRVDTDRIQAPLQDVTVAPGQSVGPSSSGRRARRAPSYSGF